MKVGVVGAGISGLSSTYLLSEDGHDVHIFEKQEELGMMSHYVEWTLPNGEDTRLDLPFRGFNLMHYVNFCRLLHCVGVKWERFSYTSSFSRINAEAQQNMVFTYETAGHLLSLPWKLLNMDFFLIARDCVWMWLFAQKDVRSQTFDRTMTIEAYLESRNFSKAFCNILFYPLLGVLMGMGYEALKDWPAEILVNCEFLFKVFGNTGHPLRALGGNRAIVEALSKKAARVHLSTTVDKVSPSSAGRKATVTYTRGGETQTEEFDHIIIATEHFRVPEIVELPEEVVVLFKKWRVEWYDLLVHTDERCMPTDREYWRPFNLFWCLKEEAPMGTIWMNKMYSPLVEEERHFFQTWNPIVMPRKETIMKTVHYSRPVMDRHAIESIEQIQAIQGNGDIWMVGAYSVNAAPLLENGVASSVEVMRRMGVPVPWKQKDFNFPHHYETPRHLQLAGYLLFLSIVAAALWGVWAAGSTVATWVF